jgi:hypothetical protein
VYFCLKWICGSTKHATLDVMCYVYDRGEEVGMYYCACYGTILVISSFVCRFIPPSFHRPPPYFALTTKHYWSNLKLSWLDSPYFIQTFANQECSKFVKSVQMYSTTIRLNTIVALKYLQFGGQFVVDYCDRLFDTFY